MKTPAELTKLFREQGLKVTPQRQCIFRVLHGNGAHPTAESVYEAAQAEMPTMSLRTVYQTLNDLADMGEIQQLDLGTGSSRFDPNVDAHHHLVCESCGTIEDVEIPARLDRSVRAALDELARTARFRVASHRVDAFGLCARCAAER